MKVCIENKPRLVEADDSGRFFALADPMVVRIEIDGRRVTVVVPAGFITDFASVPAWAWPVATKLGPWNLPAVLHDYLYFSGLFDRLTADRLFRAAMASRHVTRWRRELMYAAVRVGGRAAWDGYRAT